VLFRKITILQTLVHQQSIREAVRVAAMVLGAAGFNGTTIRQRVGAVLDGNYYALKFTVATSLQQELAYTVLIPVVEAG
jgi:hypothetical protein